MSYLAQQDRYSKMVYNYCGNSGLKLPEMSLGLWQNFGTNSDIEECKSIITTAFDNGITHFDLANNYGPLPGSAESNFGRILADTLKGYRDQLIISTKAGYTMWEGPYGDWGSKKYLVASLDQSLKRMGIDYVDIFYHHRPDPNTPLEETAHALDLIVKQGKALYVGISNYNAEQTLQMAELLDSYGTPFIIHQARYNMLDRWIEKGETSLCDVLDEKGIGCIAFSPLAQGLLSEKYFDGIPADSRRAKNGFTMDRIFSNENIDKAIKLSRVAFDRGQTLAQMAISWILRNPVITSVLVGVSSKEQLLQNLKALDNTEFSNQEIDKIESILSGN
ncbi:MAG: aldo/keto reductase [Christensenellales bacterium]